MPLISADNLSLGYASKTVASHISFTVNEGDFLCIVGHNGAGKTTLLRTLLGLQQALSGKLIKDESKKIRIGYLPQQTALQKDFPASVKEIVRSGFQASCSLLPFYSIQQKHLAHQTLRQMHMLEFENRCYRELSGGQQQRVLLARALCATKTLSKKDSACPLLMLDEPTAALDPEASSELREVLQNLNKEKHTTVIMITHDIQNALSLATHVLHIADTSFFGTLEDYRSSELFSLFTKEVTLHA
ncbi:MAG TPA: ABC transporter [Treponema sp.]|jgi:zinc transport system ATP-binding protein|nr:ABC transporter [Treponema sp.]